MKYETIVSSIADFYVRNNYIEENKIEIFKYGASLTISSIISFAIALIWGTVFNCFIEVLIFLALFIPLRIFTGGYHASTFSRCTLTFIAILSIITLSIYLIPDILIRPIALISVIAIFHSVYKYSPVQHPNAPISKDNIKKYRAISLIVCIIEISILFIFQFIQGASNNHRSIYLTISLSLLIGSALIYFAKASSIKREEV